MERRGGEHGLVLSPPLDAYCSGRAVPLIWLAPRPDSRPAAER